MPKTRTALVYLLTISHRHGNDLCAFGSEEERRTELVTYVTEWKEEADSYCEEEEPTVSALLAEGKHDAAIDLYFECLQDSEWYELETRTIAIPDSNWLPDTFIERAYRTALDPLVDPAKDALVMLSSMEASAIRNHSLKGAK